MIIYIVLEHEANHPNTWLKVQDILDPSTPIPRHILETELSGKLYCQQSTSLHEMQNLRLEFSLLLLLILKICFGFEK